MFEAKLSRPQGLTARLRKCNACIPLIVFIGLVSILLELSKDMDRVLSSLKRMNMVKIFTIIEKQVYKKVTHFGSQISEDFEVFLRRYPSPFRSGFERGQPQDYAANLQSAA